MTHRSKALAATTVIITCALASLGAAQSGKSLYEKKCGRCHAVYSPETFSAAQWPGVVRSMKYQANLSPEDAAEITNFLVGASSGEAAASEANAEEFAPSVGGYLYTEYFHTQEKSKNFDLHYLAFYTSGWVNEKIAYLGEFELEHGGRDDHTFVEQAYIDYWFAQNAAVKIGAMLAPFNRFDEFHDPLTNPLITRPQVSRELGVSAWKDVGVDLHGYFNLDKQNSLAYNAYAINGLGAGKNIRGSRQYRDNNEDVAFGARVNYLFRDLLEIGGSIYNGAWDDERKYDLKLYGAHIMLKTDAVDFYAEYASANSENPPDTLNPSGDGEMSGYFVQLSRRFEKKYKATVRFGGLDYLDNGRTLGRTPTNKDLREIALGLTYYTEPNVAFKIEYRVLDEGARVTEVNNNQIGLQAAVKY